MVGIEHEAFREYVLSNLRRYAMDWGEQAMACEMTGIYESIAQFAKISTADSLFVLLHRNLGYKLFISSVHMSSGTPPS
jgi:hypothetical protein